MSSNTSSDSYYTYCKHCVDVLEGDYRVLASWVKKNTSSSVANFDLTHYANSKDRSAASVVSQIYYGFDSACLSGIWIFKKDTPVAFKSNLGDRYISASGCRYNIYMWGTNEDCSKISGSC